MRRLETTQYAALLTALFALSSPGIAEAQLSALSGAGAGANVSQSEPVTFTADQVEYDRENALVIARGRVEAWQNDHVLRADMITFDRNTGVAAAKDNVVLLEPDGQIVFAEYAEMTKNMRDGIMKDMRALLTQNGRLAANGMRRTDGQINELSRVVYSACDLCKDDPTKPPLWQLKARSAVQDLEHQRIEYHDAVMEMYGIPVGYVPYFWHPDPSVKRQSGILTPTLGLSSKLGGFYGQPYYWAIDAQSDATITPMLTTRAGPQVDVEYNRRFNDGFLMANVSVGYLDRSPQGTLVTRGQFAYDENWRWGFDINRASSSNYVRAFHTGTGLIGDANVLPGQIYAEGFGQGAYSRLETRFYQGLTGGVSNSRLPIVLPRYQYSYFGRPDSLGGRTSVDAGFFNVFRTDGTNTRRLNTAITWERPFRGALGDLWKVSLHGDAIGYNATRFNSQPNFGPFDKVESARILPQAALDFRWPFARDAGKWGRQIIEPMAQVIVAPQSGDSQMRRYPNEDSLDFEYSDANLFGFNRFPGVDRLEGGVRANVALHGAWHLDGTVFDGLVGQSYRTNKNPLFPAPSGLRDQVSDVVARGSVTPTDWLDLTVRTRLDKKSAAMRMIDAVTTVGGPRFQVTGGYLHSNYNPTAFYDSAQPLPSNSSFYTPRNEATIGVSTSWGQYRATGYARRDLSGNRMVSWGADLIYEDECYIFDLRLYRRYTSLNNDRGSTTVLFLLSFKTVGQIGYRAL